MVTYRASGAATSVATQTASFTGLSLSASLQIGDLVLVMTSSSSSSSTQCTYGISGGGVTSWTAVGTQPARAGSGTAYAGGQLFRGIVTSAGGGTLTLTNTAANDYAQAAYWAGYGINSTPVDVYPTPIDTNTGGNSFTSPSGTTGAATGDWCVSFLTGNFSTHGGGTYTAPAGSSTLRASSNGSDGQLVAVSDNATALGAGAGFGGGSWGYSTTATALTFSVTIATAGTVHSSSVSLSGSGSLGAAGVFAGGAALTGSGTLTGTGTSAGFGGGAALSGTGSLTGAGTGTFFQSSPLSGIGTLSATWIGLLQVYPVTLSGIGTLGVSGEIQQFPAALFGNGTLSVLQATGGTVFASPGATAPQAYPMSSQVAVAPPGSSNWKYLGTLGVVTSLTYSFVCPGGADKMTCTVMVPAAYRTQMFNPGWQVRITRGGHQVWDGKLDEPVPTSSGWTLTAVGTGTLGQNFEAFYAYTWPANQPDEAINRAIARGLNWTNPGVGTPAGMWFGQAVDPAAQTITALLNLVCTRGGLTWYVNSQPGGLLGDDLSVFPLPTVPNRLLMCTTPVPRTLGGDINSIYIRYMSSADNATTGAAAAYSYTIVTNQASVTAHGTIETYIDLSDVGVQTLSAAQAIGNYVLQIYQRASFAGPFLAHYGELMNVGGTPIDPGTDQAATMVKLILTDYGYGGEVTPQFPVEFIVGAYEWDDLAQVATITPYQTLDQSLSGLLSMESTVLTPITVA